MKNNMNQSRVISCGKIDYYGHGRKVNEVRIKLELKLKTRGPTAFSCSAYVMNSKGTDCLCGGQCLDKIFKYEELAPYAEIYELWKKYHLNDMHAGTPAQEKALADANLLRADYGEQVRYLESIGLLRDESFEYCGEAYRYGTAWLTRRIPRRDLNAIRRWIETGRKADSTAA